MAVRETPRDRAGATGGEPPGGARHMGLTEARIAAAFRGAIEPVRVGPLYRLGLLVVAVTMVILPLLYVALVILFGWGIWWHATHNTTILDGRGGSKGKLLVYAAPIVVGLVVLLFLVKPLFARPGRRPSMLTVGPRDEPLLHSLVAKICAAIGAPLPAEIVVDCDVNASAGFRRGLLSFFGRDLTLTVGLPYVAGLDIRQFAGVLAHEFGHFAQGTGMRLTYIIRSVNAWFARVVYERDEWDERVARWAKESDARIGIVLQLARGMVWLTRRVLWALMICGHAVSCFMLRQMEYDADRRRLRLTGSRGYGAARLQARLLHLASQAAFSDLGRSWKQGRLADDFPQLVLGNLSRMPEDVRREVERSLQESRTGFFDTHPSDADRVRRAEAEKSPGVFGLEGRAAALFRDFAETSRQATMLMYRETIGDEVTRENLVPTASLLRGQDEEEEDRRALRRYFQDCVDPDELPTLPARLEPLDDPSAAVEELRRLRRKIEEVAPKARSLYRDVRGLEARIAQLDIVRAFKESGVAVDANDIGLSSTSFPDLEAARRDAAERRDELVKKLAPLSAAMLRRSELALRILASPAHGAARDTADTDHLRSLLEAQAALGASRGPILDLERTCYVNRALANALQGLKDEDGRRRILNTLQRGIEAWSRQLESLRLGLGAVTYPFDHPKGRVSVADHAIGKVPATTLDPGPFFPVALGAWEELRSLAVRVRGRLALLAERVEVDAAGLEPLPEPPEEEEEKKE